MRPLIEKIGLTTLVISDLDSASPDNKYASALPVRNKGLVTSNSTIYKWFLNSSINDAKIDYLFDLSAKDKIINNTEPDNYALRIAYQTPIIINSGKYKSREALCTTFEDSLIYTNIDLFETENKQDESEFENNSFVKKVKVLLTESKQFRSFHKSLYGKIKKEKFKAEFALDLIYEVDPAVIRVPEYIDEGLVWLTNQLIIEPEENNEKQINSDEDGKSE